MRGTCIRPGRRGSRPLQGQPSIIGRLPSTGAANSRICASREAAYGDSVIADLASAVEDLRARPHRLDQCMRAMAMTTVSKATLWACIKALVR